MEKFWRNPWYSPAPWNFNGPSPTGSSDDTYTYGDVSGGPIPFGGAGSHTGEGGRREIVVHPSIRADRQELDEPLDPTAPTAPTPAVIDDPGGRGGGGGGGDVAPAPGWTLGAAPEFIAPTYRPTSGADVFNDPGYKFRLSQGEGALQASAAAKGVTRTGGTLADIIKYGSDYAGSEFGNADARNRANYALSYQAAKDSYAPRMADWNRAWDLFQFQNPTWAEAHRPPQQQQIPPFNEDEPVF